MFMIKELGTSFLGSIAVEIDEMFIVTVVILQDLESKGSDRMKMIYEFSN